MKSDFTEPHLKFDGHLYIAENKMQIFIRTLKPKWIMVVKETHASAFVWHQHGYHMDFKFGYLIFQTASYLHVFNMHSNNVSRDGKTEKLIELFAGLVPDISHAPTDSSHLRICGPG